MWVKVLSSLDTLVTSSTPQRMYICHDSAHNRDRFHFQEHRSGGQNGAITVVGHCRPVAI